MPGVQARRWCWTLNNPTGTTLALHRDDTGSFSTALTAKGISYYVAGEETGEGGTFHLQGYIETRNRISPSTCKSLLNDLFGQSPHFEVAKGTSDQAAAYCKKDDTWREYGIKMKCGVRRSITEASALIESGCTLGDIARSFPEDFVRYHRGFDRMIQIQNSRPDAEVPQSVRPRVTVLFGPTGTGKSHYPRSICSDLWSHPGGKWFDGYCGQEAVVFDDFDGQDPELGFRFLLRLLDKYPISVQIKNGFANWRPKHIFFTTNVHPNHWYLNSVYDPLKRRISELLHCDEFCRFRRDPSYSYQDDVPEVEFEIFD